MRRDELLTRINFDIIDYLNEPLDNGTEQDLKDAMETIYEVVKENLEWYAENGLWHDRAELTLTYSWK